MILSWSSDKLEKISACEWKVDQGDPDATCNSLALFCNVTACTEVFDLCELKSQYMNEFNWFLGLDVSTFLIALCVYACVFRYLDPLYEILSELKNQPFTNFFDLQTGALPRVIPTPRGNSCFGWLKQVCSVALRRRDGFPHARE